MYGDAYAAAHPLPPSQLKVIQDIAICRTAALGGHLHQCDTCGYEHPVYNSCGNRHCPRCQSLAAHQWLQARMAELLPVPYFHMVFTLPHLINPVARCNKTIIYNILFASVSKTLLQFGANPDNGMGGTLGFIAVLHTWDQKLLEHIHLHCVIPAGALSPDRSQWIHPKHPDFLFPVQALSRVFRGKFIHELKKTFFTHTMVFHGQSKEYESESAFLSLINNMYKTNWVVYAKQPFAGPQHVLAYLSRYTHKIAISNNRIKQVVDDTITFSCRDRKQHDALKTMTLPVGQFISRFLLHVLPHSFTRIRHFGFLANRRRKITLAHVRKLLGAPEPPAHKPQPTTEKLLRTLSGIDITHCPRCKSGSMVVVKKLPKCCLPAISASPFPLVFDSS
jgi:hypothetical protein